MECQRDDGRQSDQTRQHGQPAGGCVLLLGPALRAGGRRDGARRFRRGVDLVEGRRRGRPFRRRRQRRRNRGLSLQPQAKLLVVLRLLVRTQQADPRRGHLVEQLFGQRRVLAAAESLQVRHPLVGGVLNHFRIALEDLDPQQPVMVNWPTRRGNAEPLQIRIESVAHELTSLQAEALLIVTPVFGRINPQKGIDADHGTNALASCARQRRPSQWDCWKSKKGLPK